MIGVNITALNESSTLVTGSGDGNSRVESNSNLSVVSPKATESVATEASPAQPAGASVVTPIPLPANVAPQPPAAPATAGLASVGSALSFEDERFKLASRSDCIGVVDAAVDADTASLERAWLLQRGAVELPRTLPFSKNTSTFFAAAASVIQFASSSSVIPSTNR